MKKGLLGAVVGAAAAVGGAAWAAKRLLGSGDDSSTNGQYNAMAGSTGTMAATEPAPRREGLDPVLLEILACPEDKQPVIYQKEGDAERLTCTSCGKRYPVRDGIPVMLIDEAQPGPVPTQDEVAAAKAAAPEGKPAIVGAPSTTASASSTSAASSGASGSPSSSSPTSTGTAPTGGTASAADASSTKRVEGGKSLDAGSGVG